MAVLLCLAQTASAVATRSLEKTASGNFFADPGFCTGETAPESLQPQWKIDPAATQSASGRQDWLSADPIGERGGMNLYGYIGNDPLNGVDPYGLWVWHVAGFGLDLAAQLAMNGGDLNNVNWGSTLISAGTGALGVGLGANVAKITGSIAARATLNALGSAAIGAAGQAANNAMDDCKSWDEGLGQAALLNGMLGGASSAAGDKFGRLANAAAARAAWFAASLPQKQLIVGGSITVGHASGSEIGTGIGNVIGVMLSNSGPITNIPVSKSSSGSSGCK